MKVMLFFTIKAYQIRVYGFFDADRFIMCRAVEKKRNKADPTTIRLVDDPAGQG